MSAEGTRPAPERDREQEPAAEVRVDGSPVRCPFCHEDVRVSEPDWVACAGCLARHHGECWSEAGRCGACGATESLARVAPASPPADATTPAATASATSPPAPADAIGWATPYVGATRRLTFTRTVPGEVDEGIDEVVVTEIRRRLKVLGRFERLGRTLTWTTLGTGPQGGAGAVPLTVSVSSRDGATTLEVDQDLQPQIVGAWILGSIFGLMLGLMTAAGLGGNGFAVAAAILGPLVAITIFALSRLIYTHAYRKQHPLLAELTDALEAELRRRARRPRADPKAP